jgi:hypothetical protein
MRKSLLRRREARVGASSGERLRLHHHGRESTADAPGTSGNGPDNDAWVTRSWFPLGRVDDVTPKAHGSLERELGGCPQPAAVACIWRSTYTARRSWHHLTSVPQAEMAPFPCSVQVPGTSVTRGTCCRRCSFHADGARKPPLSARLLGVFIAACVVSPPTRSRARPSIARPRALDHPAAPLSRPLTGARIVSRS